ncbi:MAG: Hsp20 family protein, partial [Clostridia bacterium]|nr:Hsp20 family protein [Clostridia bacterium]
DSIKQEDIKAKYENGILCLTIPKAQPKLPEKSYIAIE